MKIIVLVILGLLGLTIAQSYDRDANGVYRFNSTSYGGGASPISSNSTYYNYSSIVSNYSNYSIKSNFSLYNVTRNPFWTQSRPGKNFSLYNMTTIEKFKSRFPTLYDEINNNFSNISYSNFNTSLYKGHDHDEYVYNNNFDSYRSGKDKSDYKLNKGTYLMMIFAVLAKLILFVVLVFILVKSCKNCRERRMQQRYNRMSRQPSQAGIILPVSYQMQQLPTDAAGLYPQLPHQHQGAPNNYVVGVPVGPQLAQQYMANRPQSNQSVPASYPGPQSQMPAFNQNAQQAYGISQYPPSFPHQQYPPQQLPPHNMPPAHHQFNQGPPQVYNYPQFPQQMGNFPQAGANQNAYQYPKLNE